MFLTQTPANTLPRRSNRMNSRQLFTTFIAVLVLVSSVVAVQAEAPSVDYAQAAAVLAKYCVSCHNDVDREGKLSLASLNSLRAGLPDGPVIVAGSPEESKLLQLLAGKQEPTMPPEDEPQPTPAEIEILRAWIKQGAHGEELATGPYHLATPNLPSAASKFHHVSAACMIGENGLVQGGLGQVELSRVPDNSTRWKVMGLAGKVNSLRSSADQGLIIVGGGVAGLGGEALLLNASDGSTVQRFIGHSDTIYCASLSPDRRILATGSYDRKIILWDVSSGNILRELTGHNGAIYDLDFDFSGKLLATASADQTVKLWRVADGERLDTLGQPEREQRCVRFSPDGQFILAAGGDKQIRKWQVVSREKPAINPMLIARYAHESDIVQLEFLDQQRLLSSSIDQTVKLWEVQQLSGLGTVAKLSDVPVGICLTANLAKQDCVVQLDGQRLPLQLTPAEARHTSSINSRKQSVFAGSSETAAKSRENAKAVEFYSEAEPNDQIDQALSVTVPATVSGVIGAANGQEDRDLIRFSAKQGETWIVEVAAASQGSPLDSRIEILDEQGHGVLRTRLQATRESYFTFRGKDSNTSDDFRLHKWEDMELDEFLYSNGEVNRLWHYPRGPDSGFRVYPGSGSRVAFFDTTPLSHALGEPTYIVRPLADDETPLPNGLPIFTLLYENDDDGLTRFGKDSRLTFVAPQTADYFLRIRDARGFGGDDFVYQTTIRKPAPDFKLKLRDTKMALPANSGRAWSAHAERVDGLDSPIAIHLDGLPEGVLATNPVIIEAGQEVAEGCIYVTPEAAARLIEAEVFSVNLSATYEHHGERIVKQLAEQLEIQLTDKPELQVQLFPAEDPKHELEELTIRPGQTVSARVRVLRNGEKSRVEFGKDEAGHNLPHGAFVDNIGLNGLLIPEDQTEREFFITAAPKVQPGRRQFHLQSNTAGKPTSRPIWLNVLPAP